MSTTYNEILRDAFHHCQVPTLDHVVPVYFSAGSESERCDSLAEVDELAALGDYSGPAEDYRLTCDYSSNNAREIYARCPDRRACTIEALRNGAWSTVFEVCNRLE